MEQQSKELKKVKRGESVQEVLIKYIVYVGKWFLYFLPIILVAITITTVFGVKEIPEATRFSEQSTAYQVLTLIYVVIIGIYFLNSLILLISSIQTGASLSSRLEYEKKRGRPIQSLDGFEYLYDNVEGVLKMMTLTSIVCIISVALFITMLIFGDINLSFAAMATSLVGVGLAITIRSLNLDIHNVNGLQDFFKPLMHQIYLDNYFSEVFANHIDPITYLKWDEYKMGIKKLLTSKFIDQIKKKEKDEMPITFAVERLLFLYYLEYQGVLTEEQMTNEAKEILNANSKDFDLEKGFLIEDMWYFSKQNIFDLFEFIKEYNSGFFTLIDRLQLELADNIERISKDPVYCDTTSQETVTLNTELNIMAFIYNNSKNAEKYRIRISAPGFEPNDIRLDMKVEGRGDFEIPTKPIPLISKNEVDITQVLSTMLENGDTAWVTLEPRQKGEQTIQIFLETAEGEIIEGETRIVKVKKDMKTYLKKLSSLGSVVSGIAVALSRALF